MAALENGRDRKRLSPEALVCLEHYHWPGNVRKLKNVMERAVLLADREVIRPQDLPDELRIPPDRIRVIEALQRHLEPNISAAAKDLGYAREHLHRLIKKHNIRPQDIMR